MINSISPNTQSILLLTAPLIAGRSEASADILKPGEYIRLARFLHDRQREPADLLASDSGELLRSCQPLIDSERLRRLLDRGFMLSQAFDHWQTRAIWVLSRADGGYPRRLKTGLKDDAPPVLYGCGDAAMLDAGGLAVVGSREVGDELVRYTEGIGRLAAKAGRSLISGAARGIDRAAMSGALEAGGTVAGVLADSLERAALNREHRNLLMEGQLVLISPYDPSAGFNIGHAMQRNKLIYALADAALVVSSDYQKGGTWAGAVEQLEKHRLVPVYVRSSSDMGRGLEALGRKGALLWPDPSTPEEFIEALTVQTQPRRDMPSQEHMPLPMADGPAQEHKVRDEVSHADAPRLSPAVEPSLPPAEELFATVRSLVERMETPRTDGEVAAQLNVSKRQAKEWLRQLVKDGVLEKLSGPVRYRSVSSRSSQAPLFDGQD